MRSLESLALRLTMVETKLATLTGTSANTILPSTAEELDARLSVVEVQVDRLIAEKTEKQIAAIVAAPADHAPLTIASVVALSPSVCDSTASEIVADVVSVQMEASAIENQEVAAVVAAAVEAVVKADPEVVADPEAVKLAITEAVAQMPAPAPEVEAEVAAAVAEVVAAATGKEVTAEVQQQITDAVTATPDPVLDHIDSRLAVVEAKVDNLLGKL